MDKPESIYNQVLKLFDYAGKIDNKSKSYGNYSPNNIKRVIISPDQVIVEYHIKSLVPQTGGRNFRYVAYNYIQLQAEQMSRGYKPLISIALKRVCSSIEEIIFLSQSYRYPDSSITQSFISIETNFRDINSFVRLHYITILNMSLSQFMRVYPTYLTTYFITDNSDIQGVIVSKKVVVDKWYQSWGSSKSKSTYPVEMTHLSSYFQKIKDKKEQEELSKKPSEDNKDSDKDKDKDKDIATKLKELNTIINTYQKLFIFNKTFAEVTSSEPFHFKQLEKVRGTHISDYFLKDSNLPEQEALQTNIDYIKNLKIEMAKSYYIFFVNKIKDLSSNHPIIARSLLSGNELVVDAGSVPKNIEEKTGFKFIEGKPKVSEVLSGVSALSCKLFFYDVDNKYKDKDYWRSLI